MTSVNSFICAGTFSFSNIFELANRISLDDISEVVSPRRNIWKLADLYVMKVLIL
jgi:hypothetical protein